MSEKVDVPSLVVNPIQLHVSAPMGAALASVVATNENEGFISNIVKTINENRSYLYIAVGVVILGFVLYYFYIKNKSIASQQTKVQPAKVQPAKVQKPQARQSSESKKVEVTKPKLQHPGSESESSSSEESVVTSEENNMDQYNLTNSEINEITNKLKTVPSDHEEDE